ncbi:MAG: NADP-dependent phosphogluconate dehydrogenase, partial [Polyangiaceae bacterium]
MKVGMIGLGRMGSNMVRRLLKVGHECVVFDVHSLAGQELVKAGATATRSLAELVTKLDKPRAIWLMVPAVSVESTLTELVPLLAADDAVIDGGNSYYHDDIRRAECLGKSGIHYIDAGTSGGVWGFERGYCLMIGGDPIIVKRLDGIFAALAPGIEGGTPSRPDGDGTAQRGYIHCGPSGAGHFVKMVHNGIEYGVMAA